MESDQEWPSWGKSHFHIVWSCPLTLLTCRKNCSNTVHLCFVCVTFALNIAVLQNTVFLLGSTCSFIPFLFWSGISWWSSSRGRPVGNWIDFFSWHLASMTLWGRVDPLVGKVALVTDEAVAGKVQLLLGFSHSKPAGLLRMVSSIATYIHKVKSC